MKIDLTPRQVDLVRGAIVLKIDTIAEQIIEPSVDDEGRIRTLPPWQREHNAESRRDIDVLDRVLGKLNGHHRTGVTQ